jgi:hypothetical protein
MWPPVKSRLSIELKPNTIPGLLQAADIKASNSATRPILAIRGVMANRGVKLCFSHHGDYFVSAADGFSSAWISFLKSSRSWTESSAFLARQLSANPRYWVAVT